MKIPFFSKKEEKATPVRVLFADESARGALNKAVMPNYLLNPPFGIPRFKNIFELRRLGRTPQARMAKQTLIDEITSIPWDMIPIDKEKDIDQGMQNRIDEITSFLNNPNTNSESLSYLFRIMLEDVYDLDSGILTKEFNESGRMVELRAVDSGTFLKNPDIYGKFTDRADIIFNGVIGSDRDGNIDTTIRPLDALNAAMSFQERPGLSVDNAKERAAYFQFGVQAHAKPIAFGRREIVWFEKNPQPDQIYGKSPVETILEVLQSLKYSIEYNLDYFEDNNVPKGFISMPGADDEELNAFRDRWNELQLKTNNEGLLKKNFHRVPITNSENANFIRVQFSAEELQLIESQKWFSNLVFATYGVSPSELGFTENSNLATEVNQSRVTRRKGILPMLKMIEFYMNSKVISEWGFDDLEFKFNTFDIEDEKAKWDLYDLQIRTGARTVNEIRVEEGMDELEESEIQAIAGQGDPNKEEKPKDPDPDDSKKRAEDKSFDEFMKQFNKIIKEDEKRLLLEARRNSVNRLTQIKDFDSLIRSIEKLFGIANLKALVNNATKNLFNKGLDETEESIKAQGVVVNAVSSSPEKIKFLSDMAFENIVALSNQMKSRLRQQLKSGIANGEGIGTLSTRIQSVFDVTKSRAEMIARTEASRVESAGALHAAEQIKADGVNVKKYLLWTLDDRTSDLTKALHRKYGSREKAIPLDQNFTITFGGKTFSQMGLPFHPNERDSLIAFVVG